MTEKSCQDDSHCHRASVIGLATAYGRMMVIEFNGELYGGGQAAARRVKLPWGGAGFAFASVNSAGLELMRRSIIWAAAGPTCTAIQIQLQGALDSSQRVVTQVQILNRPEL